MSLKNLVAKTNKIKTYSVNRINWDLLPKYKSGVLISLFHYEMPNIFPISGTIFYYVERLIFILFCWWFGFFVEICLKLKKWSVALQLSGYL